MYLGKYEPELPLGEKLVEANVFANLFSRMSENILMISVPRVVFMGLQGIGASVGEPHFGSLQDFIAATMTIRGDKSHRGRLSSKLQRLFRHLRTL